MTKEKSSEYISRTSKDYSLYVNEIRGLPRIGDGLKDGQRKALWLMRNKAESIKIVALGGMMIAEELYLHGDAAANTSISELAAPFKNNLCFLEGDGILGDKLSPSSFGAPRYVSVKRAKAAEDILFADLDIVPLMDNYDGSNQSAATFLPLIPTILLNGVSGMGVGWSTDILPHKLSDIIDACINELDGKKIKKLKPYFENYDVDIEHIEDSSWAIIGKYKKIDPTTLTITELPLGMKIEKFIMLLDELEENGKIQSYIDKSKENANVIIKFKRGDMPTDHDSIIKLFKLRTRVTQRIVVIGWDGKTINTYDSPEAVVKDFIAWRTEWYTTRFTRLLESVNDDLRYYKALKLCFDNKFAEKLQKFKSKQEALDWVLATTKKFNLEDSLSNRIVGLPSYKWTKEGEDEVITEIKRLEGLKKEYTNILSSKTNLTDVYKNELLALKKKYV